MATTETLRPTVATQLNPTLTNGANAYDGSTVTFATVSEATEGQTAAANWDGFPAGAILATKRRSVVLEVYLDWGSADTNDKAAVYARAKGTDPWTLLSNAKPPNVYTGTYVVLDITDLVGVEPLTSLDIQVVFGNYGTGSGDDPPEFTI